MRARILPRFERQLQSRLKLGRYSQNGRTATGKLPCATATPWLLFAGWKFQFRRHSNQFCQRLGLHFPHYMAAMDLHSDFADSPLKSYLLIEPARDNQAHDLALALAQSLIAFSQLGGVTLLMPRHTVAIQSLADRVQQVLIMERLGQE